MPRGSSQDFTEDYIWECYNSLLLSQDIERVRKLVVRYQLFEKALAVPGDIVECGVFKGAGLMYWAKLLAVLSPASVKRVVGFDTFSQFADSLESYEKDTADAYVKEAGFDGLNPSTLMKLAEAAGLGERVELIEGDIQETASKYVANNPGFRVSLLHIDVDSYRGTKAALEAFYPMVSRSGVVILDEYGSRGWGESQAVDEYFADIDVEILAIPNSHKPTAYLVKP